MVSAIPTPDQSWRDTSFRDSGALEQPTPWKAWVRPMLILAVGIHGILLFVPLPGAQEASKPAKDKEAPVKITKVSTSAPKLAKVTPKPNVPAKLDTPKVNRPASVTQAPPPVTPPKPVEKAPDPVKTPDASKTDTPPAQKPGEEKGTESGTELNNTPTPFSDFPHYNPSTPDCFSKGLGDSCRIVQQPLAALTSYFEKEVPGKKFTLSSPEAISGGKVYEVSKGNMKLFLSLLEDGGSTVYILAPQAVRDLSELKAAAVVPDDLVQAVGAVASETSSDEDFSAPNYFYSQLSQQDQDGSLIAAEPKGAIHLMQKAKGVAPEAILGQLRSQMSGMEVAAAAQYGGGALYQLKRGSFKGYLNLVPTKDGNGTNVIIWAENPAS
jgi:hypothetical protein